MHYRTKADQETYSIIAERQDDSRWLLPDRSVEPDPKSRLSDVSDPDEAMNLATENPEVLSQMRATLERVRAEQTLTEVASQISDLDLEEMEQLAALGYIEAAATFAPEERPDPRRFVGAHTWVQAGRTMASQGQYDRAIELLETFVESRSVRALVLRTLAPVYVEAGRVDDAIRAYGQYIELTGSSEARLGLARLFLRNDRPEEALDVIASLDRPTASGTLLRAQALARLGRHAEARAAIDSTSPRRNRAQRRHNRAHLVLYAAPVSDGEEELRGLLAEAPQDAVLKSRLGFYLSVWGP